MRTSHFILRQPPRGPPRVGIKEALEAAATCWPLQLVETEAHPGIGSETLKHLEGLLVLSLPPTSGKIKSRINL